MDPTVQILVNVEINVDCTVHITSFYKDLGTKLTKQMISNMKLHRRKQTLVWLIGRAAKTAAKSFSRALASMLQALARFGSH